MVSGIHHVTSITADVQANVDFYAGFLGLRLVKRTAGYSDSEQLHLIYGDHFGSPGSLISFLVWEATGSGRTGVGQVSELALTISPASIGHWVTRALSANVHFEGLSREFGESVLRLKDPDGLIVKLVGVETASAEPAHSAPARVRGVTLLTDKADETAKFVSRFGYSYGQRAGMITRMVSETDIVDIREVTGFVPSVAGAGVPDHVAFRAPTADAVVAKRLTLKDYGPTEVHDRKYFLSMYLRDPAGILLEYATDGPGLTVDETLEQLGQTLFTPPHDAERANDRQAMLPQFSLPGEERFPSRHLHFVHRFNRPKDPDGSTILLLHGSGGNEADLMPIARQIAPQATLLGVRGRAIESGSSRWFGSKLDEAEIHCEAEAFAAFVSEAMLGYHIDDRKLVFLGYSNGANFLAAVIQLFPDTVKRAILLRSIQVLNSKRRPDLSAVSLKMLNGRNDPYRDEGSRLAQCLRACGAKVQLNSLPAGHSLSKHDVAHAANWLQAQCSNTQG